ncbi:hypothetical protein LMG31886_01500 [Xanthomonas hydrangeae]|nr:hypothetical protein LMG31886_01500 [Xanthomonas hydrangeae]CAD7720519.1 hypothetical protein LMG31886_01500 [Xanthomonas hydrangeae]CAD7729773.1 hypothetical protein LMG31885_13980 [Xanthomonas hydrangeae]CAD7729777.1 hypothetical protein LMG31885_13980 [Xanthomonas hydrangeae]
MNRVKYFALTLLISGCAGGIVEKGEMSNKKNFNGLKESYRLKAGEVLEVAPGNIDAARATLGNKDYAKISVDFFKKISGLDGSYVGNKKYFIVKSKKDDMEGVYSAFFSQGRLTLIYNHMGECGKLVSDIVVVVVDAELTELSSGCSGVL